MRLTASVCVLTCGMLATLLVPSMAMAQGRRGAVAKTIDKAGAVEGAIWRFELTPQPGNRFKGTLRGAYRVSDLVAYQKSDKEGEEDRRIGTSKPGPKGKTTIFTVEDMKARKHPKDADDKPVVLKGEAVLKLVAPGENRIADSEAEGMFIDSEGRHWTMKCTRIRE